MTRMTVHAIPIAAAMLIFIAAPSAQQTGATQKPHEHPAAGEAQPTSDMAAKCQEMMKHHEKMMADQKAADQRLDTLVAKMNAASGQAKADATSTLVTEMVAQRKAMHESMMAMHHGAMMHMAEHMQAGKESMAMCPMMKMKMGGAKH